MQKVMITGATGFIGSNLLSRLVAESYDVSVIIRKSSSKKNIEDYLEQITVFEAGIDVTAVEISRFMSEVEPDVVIHLASLYIGEHDSADIENLINSNVLFGAQLLEAMSVSGCNKLINIGTSWQHFNNADYEPANLYAATKQAFIDIAKFYESAKIISIIDLKLFDTYGPTDQRKKLIPYLLKNLDGNADILLSPGDQLINMLHVNDVVDCICVAIGYISENNDVKYEEYSVGSNEVVSLKELVKIIEKVSGKSLSTIKWGARDYRDREVMKPWEGGSVLPGWKQKISLEKGIKEMLGEGCE